MYVCLCVFGRERENRNRQKKRKRDTHTERDVYRTREKYRAAICISPLCIFLSLTGPKKFCF